MPKEFIANAVPKELSGNRFSRDVARDARNVAWKRAYSDTRRSALRSWRRSRKRTGAAERQHRDASSQHVVGSRRCFALPRRIWYVTDWMSHNGYNDRYAYHRTMVQKNNLSRRACLALASGRWIPERHGASRRWCQCDAYSIGPVAVAFPLTLPS